MVELITEFHSLYHFCPEISLFESVGLLTFTGRSGLYNLVRMSCYQWTLIFINFRSFTNDMNTAALWNLEVRSFWRYLI